MSRCKKCNIEILDETERCPLCNSILEQTIEVENMYPTVRLVTRKLMLISHIYLFAAIVTEALLVVANVLLESQTWWSLITGLALLYGYLLIRYAILGKSGYRSKIFVLTVIAVLMLIAIDLLAGYRGWAVTYVLPSCIIATDAGILFLMYVNRRNWQSYMMWQIVMILISVVSLILSIKGVANQLLLGIAANAISVFLFLGTLIIGDRRARSELKRRFHMK